MGRFGMGRVSPAWKGQLNGRPALTPYLGRKSSLDKTRATKVAPSPRGMKSSFARDPWARSGESCALFTAAGEIVQRSSSGTADDPFARQRRCRLPTPKDPSMKTASRIAAFALVVGLTGAVASTAMAAPDTTWQKNHPRREQVNQRLANQNARIKAEVKEGELTPSQAAALHRKDRQIRREERLMASQNGGHITKQEQRTLNQQENALSKQIGK